MDKGFLVLSWNDIVDLSLELARKIMLSKYVPDAIVAILRGGYIVAKLVSDYLGIEHISTLEIKFYKGIGEKAERPIVISPIVHDLRGKKVLIVDDVADSGRTLQVAIDIVRLHGAKDVRTATLYLKPWSITMPDYYVADTKSWIVFPWEVGEILRELKGRYGSLEEALKQLELEKYYQTNILEKLLKILEAKYT
ncbi:phosphoribosyltransferase [Ignisphaera aggregans DSM 17230]|uniref:Phosphoribosyltransferase n=1 Tax=Ignisphaera aggregans (strain DSM 17230 / JCM 13409 / AQ1.S1) TaxID=583356 RepID=E0SQB6_IGNAA|nr:phosphoribosyltransferase [Ignisphaera aggregans DSM 17230]